MSRNSFNWKLSFSLTFIIFCSYVAQGKFFKRILLPGTSWPSWVNNRRTPTNPSPFECIANCSSLGPTNCNVIFNDPLNNTCWMGLVGGNFGYQTLLGQPGDAWGMIDFDYISDLWSTNVIPIQSIPNTYYLGYINNTINIASTDGLWDCNFHCNLIQNGTCHYFTYANGLCSIGNFYGTLLIPSTGPTTTVYVHKSQLLDKITPTLKTKGATWSQSIFKVINGLSTTYECMSHCYLYFSPKCVYSVFDGINCYLGDPKLTTSVIPPRTDAQDMYYLSSSFFRMPSTSTLFLRYIIRNSTSTSLAFCESDCSSSPDCHFTLFTGSECLTGNFDLTPISYVITLSENVSINQGVNIANSDYIKSNVSNTVWTPKIFTSYAGIASEGLCSAICSLYTGPTPCELYVYTSLTCYIGSLYTLGSYTTQPAGNYTLNTKKLVRTDMVSGTGIFLSPCSPGLNVLSCGTSNSQSTNWDPQRAMYPDSSSSCKCYDRTTSFCNSHCTTLPASNFVITNNSVISSLFGVSCPSGYKVMGCHAYGYKLTAIDNFRFAIPFLNGSGCSCGDTTGIRCYATCVANIKNYEIVGVYGSYTIYSFCNNPKNFVLGCSFYPNSTAVASFRYAYAQSDTGCECYSDKMGTCYATCGTL